MRAEPRQDLGSPSGSETPTPPKRVIQLSVAFFDALDVAAFFDDSLTNDHVEATAEDCAAEARRYIEEKGMWNFVNDWGLTDFDVYVGIHQVALSGRVVPPSGERT